MLCYVYVETRYKEYWVITKDPMKGIKNIVDLHNSNCYYDEDKLMVEQFIEEYPDGKISEIEMNKAYDNEYHKPCEVSKSTWSWKEWMED